MDGIPKEIDFLFTDVSADTNSLSEPWQVYLRIIGNFVITVGGKTLYTEPGFCLVEFAIQSQLWLRRVRETREDFIYSSQESEEPGLVWIKKSDSGWKLGSVYQEYEEHSLFDLDHLRRALMAYFDALDAYVRSTFAVEITNLFSWADESLRSGNVRDIDNR